jgi:uncharacterized LabA/DUF88 family protein
MIQDWHGPATDAKPKACVALLVDGENVSQSQATGILDLATRYGALTIRRVYGDMALLRDWEADHRFTSHHTGHGRGKNTADINLVIDAMDMAHSKRATVFVVVSSDGDFAPLATRLREEGLVVVGLGRSKASQSFKDACTEFCAMPENVEGPVAAAPDSVRSASGNNDMQNGMAMRASAPAKAVALSRIDTAIHSLFREKVGTTCKVTLSSFGQMMPKEKQINRTDCGKATWRAYLASYPDLYILEGSGTSSTVRLKTP